MKAKKQGTPNAYHFEFPPQEGREIPEVVLFMMTKAGKGKVWLEYLPNTASTIVAQQGFLAVGLEMR